MSQSQPSSESKWAETEQPGGRDGLYKKTVEYTGQEPMVEVGKSAGAQGAT